MTVITTDDNVVSLASIGDVGAAMDRRTQARKAIEDLGNYRRMILEKNRGIGEPTIRLPVEQIKAVHLVAEGCVYIALSDIIDAIGRHRDGL